MRFDGERRSALPFAAVSQDDLSEIERAIAGSEATLVYGTAPEAIAEDAFARLGCTSLGPLPEVVRPVKVGPLPLFLPFRRGRRSGVREILVDDPRVTRLWDRFSIDIGVAVERTARWFGPRIFGRSGYRVFVFEDGDRYVIRALCAFRVIGDRGVIAELLHDRSLAGMRAASHLVGLALRELHDAGARTVHAWSLPQSGSFPILTLHAFTPRRSPLHIGVRALDPSVAALVEERGHWYLSGLDFEDT
jgi:hypothetical protein